MQFEQLSNNDFDTQARVRVCAFSYPIVGTLVDKTCSKENQVRISGAKFKPLNKMRRYSRNGLRFHDRAQQNEQIFEASKELYAVVYPTVCTGTG